MPHSSRFARLVPPVAGELFTVPSTLVTSYEVILVVFQTATSQPGYREAMYLDYFNLTDSPFQTSADPKFLWVGKQHQHVLGALENSLLDNKGLFVLTGDIGTGKTALIHAFVKSLGSKTFRAILSYPKIGKLEFFNFLAGCFHFPHRFNTEAEFFRYFTSFLRIACKFSYRVILIIDEADKLPDEIFDQILYFTSSKCLKKSKCLPITFVNIKSR
jgi:general secretion pathway protein A